MHSNHLIKILSIEDQFFANFFLCVCPVLLNHPHVTNFRLCEQLFLNLVHIYILIVVIFLEPLTRIILFFYKSSPIVSMFHYFFLLIPTPFINLAL